MTNYYNSGAELLACASCPTFGTKQTITFEDDMTPILWDDEMVNAIISQIEKEEQEATTHVTAKPKDVMDITRGFFK